MLSSIPSPVFVAVRKWYQYPKISWHYQEPESTFLTGNPNTGKGNQGIAHATNYAAEGGLVLEAFGSENDSETLHPLLKDSPYRSSTLILIGEDVEITSNPGGFPMQKISEFSFRDPKLRDYLWIVTDRCFFASQDSYYFGLARIFEMCITRRGWIEHENRRIIALKINEIWKVIASIMRAGISKNQQLAQEQLRGLNNERAHSGVSLILDTQRQLDIMPSIREMANFRVNKGYGGQTIPEEFNFAFKPSVLGMQKKKMRNMKPYQFIVFTSWNGVGRGFCQRVPWGLAKGSDYLEKLEIQVKPLSSEIQEKEKPRQVSEGNKEAKYNHERIVALRRAGKSIRQIAKELVLAAGTVASHSKAHDQGECECTMPY